MPAASLLPFTALSQGRTLADGEKEEPYSILTNVTVLAYAARTIDQWLPAGNVGGNHNNDDESAGRLRASDLSSAEEVGDGNLNLVFRLLDRTGRSRAVLKQSLPYVRCVGESWPLTLDRNRLEAETLIAHHTHAPAETERALFYCPHMAVTVVEDLSDMVIWRGELVAGRHHTHVGPRLAGYLARVHFHSSDFAQPAWDSSSKKAAAQRVTNVAMCQITEDLFFTDPFIVGGHERNNCDAALQPFVKDLVCGDAALKARVARLKHVFMSRAEAHIHGDIHTGSIFIDGSRVKAIDAEFGFYGPMGFDVGTVIGNLLINYVALPALQAQAQAKRQQQQASVGNDATATTAATGTVATTTTGGSDDDAPSCRAPTNLTAGVPSSRALLLSVVREFWQVYAETFRGLASAGTAAITDPTFTATGAAAYVDAFIAEDVFADAVGFAGVEMVRRTIGLAHVADLDGIADPTARLAAQSAVLRLAVALIKGAGKGELADVDAVLRFVEKTVATE